MGKLVRSDISSEKGYGSVSLYSRDGQTIGWTKQLAYRVVFFVIKEEIVRMIREYNKTSTKKIHYGDIEPGGDYDLYYDATTDTVIPYLRTDEIPINRKNYLNLWLVLPWDQQKQPIGEIPENIFSQT